MASLWATLPETNIAPENQWLEDAFPFGDGLFLEAMLVSGRVVHPKILLLLCLDSNPLEPQGFVGDLIFNSEAFFLVRLESGFNFVGTQKQSQQSQTEVGNSWIAYHSIFVWCLSLGRKTQVSFVEITLRGETRLPITRELIGR